jgi:hypothetical protein
LIREDFARLESHIRLRTSRLVEELILMQSIEGHAHEGHGAFQGRRFVNMTMDETVEALGRDPRVVTHERQDLIDEVAAWSGLAMQGQAPRTLVTPEGSCLLDVGTLRNIEVEPAEVLRGLYLGGLRDDSEVRLEVEKRTGLRIGGGRCYLVDVDVMFKMGLDGERLAHGAHAQDIAHYREVGLIVDHSAEESDQDKVRYLYIRDREGGGQSDDAAILAAGKMLNPSAALGAFLADAVDTLEKYVPHYSDQDDALSIRIEKQFAGLRLGREDVYRVAFASAVPPDQKQEVPDSSLRRMLTIDRRSDQTALESHLAYLEGRPYAPMLLAFEEVENTVLYQWFEERWRQAEQLFGQPEVERK